MKKIWALLFASVFASTCFAETKLDPFSPIPSWIKRSDSLHEDFRWSNFNQQKVFFDSRSGENSGMLKIPDHKPRVALLYFKVEDQRFGVIPTANDRYKEFAIPLPDDFSPFNRNMLRLRASLLLDNNWKVTIPRIKINDGNIEGRILFRKDGNFF